MPRTADYVIVGGGIVGCSIAYHLARRGATNVVVLEQGGLGSGSTSKAAGGIRAQFAAEATIRMSLYAQNVYRNFEDEFGVTADYHEVGYLFLLTTLEELESFRKNVGLQNSLGVPSRIVSPDEITEMVPAVRVEDLAGGSFCATDGTAGPSEALQGFVRRARELGVQFLENSPVIAIDLDGGRQRVRAVRTPNETFETPLVVNAAGAWASQIGKLVGVELPVRPLKRHIWVTERFDEIPGPTPQVIDFHTGFYFRKELDSVMWSGGDMLERWNFDTEVEWDRLQESVEKAARRVPILANARLLRGWAGLREVTPDHLPIIGPVTGVEGFICAAGFSGHGFMHAPASGRLVSDLLLDSRTFLDISPFRYERFSEKADSTQLELSVGARVEDE
jgi:sarcosine oxidase, subunit beta